MGKKKRKVPPMSSTSLADISFMLLLFFLLTTSMNTDKGLSRRLPPPIDKNQKIEDTKVKKRNILVVLINTYDQILVGEEYVTDMAVLRNRIKEFVDNPTNNEHMPEKVEVEVPYFGNMMVAKNHVVSLQNDRGTSYQAYVSVQGEIGAAYTELRNKISMEKFGKSFKDLPEDQQQAVQMIYPQKISEAEPKNYSKEKR